MKKYKTNLLFLISFLLIFSELGSASEKEAELYFKNAEFAYQKNDCDSTIENLNLYLKHGNPSAKRRTSIEKVIAWCKDFLTSPRSHGERAIVVQVNASGKEVDDIYSEKVPFLKGEEEANGFNELKPLEHIYESLGSIRTYDWAEFAVQGPSNFGQRYDYNLNNPDRFLMLEIESGKDIKILDKPKF